MADYEGFDTAEYDSEHFTANSQFVALRRRATYLGVEAARSATVTGGASVTHIFRGKIGGQFVFNTGSPPAGATDVVVVATIVQE
jgi:hypothetical protein